MNENPDQLYTLREIAEKIGLPESTGRYYKDNYGEFLPSVKTEGMQYPKYKSVSIEIMQSIRKLSESGKTKEEIKTELANRGYKIELSGIIVTEPISKPSQEIYQLLQAVKMLVPNQEELERLRVENQILKTLYIQAKRDNQNIQKQLAPPPKKSLLQRLKFW